MMLGWNNLYYGISFEFNGSSYTVGIGGNDELFQQLKQNEATALFVCELEAQ